MGKRLAASVRVTDEGGRQVVIPAGEEVPSWAVDQVTNEAAFEEPEVEAPVTAEAASVAEGEGGAAFEEYEGDTEAVDYDALTVADLKEEIRTRNEGRPDGDKLPVDGVKAELVAALQADDK